MTRVISFGEIMLRLSAPGYQRFMQTQSLDVTYGGGEANVAVSLAHFDLDSCYVTKVPDNLLGQCAINHLRRYGVNTDFIVKGGNRLGVYFLETGASQRPSQVVYDRTGSAIAEAEPQEFVWKEMLRDAHWFHVTGITPALGDNAAQATLDACREAKEAGVTVSCDLNYRKKLWSQEKARSVMTELMPYVDVAIANEEDAEKVFGIKAPDSDIESGVLDIDGYCRVAQELQENFDFKSVGITLRESYSASDNGWSGLLYVDQKFYRSRRYEIRIVDRVGGGDAFAAGLIYGFLNQLPPQEIIEFASASSCLKHTVPGDFNMVSVEEVKRLAEGKSSGRVQR